MQADVHNEFHPLYVTKAFENPSAASHYARLVVIEGSGVQIPSSKKVETNSTIYISDSQMVFEIWLIRSFEPYPEAQNTPLFKQSLFVH